MCVTSSRYFRVLIRAVKRGAGRIELASIPSICKGGPTQVSHHMMKNSATIIGLTTSALILFFSTPVSSFGQSVWQQRTAISGQSSSAHSAITSSQKFEFFWFGEGKGVPRLYQRSFGPTAGWSSSMPQQPPKATGFASDQPGLTRGQDFDFFWFGERTGVPRLYSRTAQLTAPSVPSVTPKGRSLLPALFPRETFTCGHLPIVTPGLIWGNTPISACILNIPNEQQGVFGQTW